MSLSQNSINWLTIASHNCKSLNLRALLTPSSLRTGKHYWRGVTCIFFVGEFLFLILWNLFLGHQNFGLNTANYKISLVSNNSSTHENN